MNIKKVLIAALSAANVLSIGAGLILTAAGSSFVKAQSCDRAAERWDPEGGHTQISCFFTDDSGFTTDLSGGVRANLITELKNIGVTAEDGKEFIPEAYSTDAGQMTIRSDTTGRAEARITSVGGSFFHFRDFKLLDGAFFSENDIMQDGAVIDRMLAWQLYGSTEISGMNIYINGVKFYIAGVIDNPQTKQEKKTSGDFPRAYISYEGLKLVNGGAEGGEDFQNDALKKISCYECIVPDPVENYAYNMVSNYFESYSSTVEIVNNSERYEPSKRAKAYKNLADYAISDKPVVYPYWENASRIVEFKLTKIYYFRRMTYIIPILTALLLIVILWRGGIKLRRKITSAIIEFINNVIYNHNQKKQKKKEAKQNG